MMPTNRAVCESKEIRSLGQFRESSWRDGSFHQDFPNSCVDVFPALSSQPSDSLVLCNLRPHPRRVWNHQACSLKFRVPHCFTSKIQLSWNMKFSKVVSSCSLVAAPFTFLICCVQRGVEVQVKPSWSSPDKTLVAGIICFMRYRKTLRTGPGSSVTVSYWSRIILFTHFHMSDTPLWPSLIVLAWTVLGVPV